MAIHAIIVNKNTIKFVNQTFGAEGVTPEMMENTTFFVYSDDFRDNFENRMLTPVEFKKHFDWRHQHDNDNVVLPK